MHIIHRVGYVFLRVVNDYSAFGTLKKRETAVDANTMQVAFSIVNGHSSSIFVRYMVVFLQNLAHILKSS